MGVINKIKNLLKPPNSDPGHGLKTAYSNLYAGIEKILRGEIRIDYKYNRIGYHALFPYEGDELKESQQEFAIATIVKNEGKYLVEWIEFHRLVGCTKFYIYDNNSDDNSQDILNYYKSLGIVEWFPWPHITSWLNTQQLAYCHAIYQSRGKVRWLACIDADEFIFSPLNSNLTKILTDYIDVPSLVVYWTMFGTSGHVSRPQGLVTENYTLCMDVENPNNKYKPLLKSIVQPHRVKAVSNPHYFQTDAWPMLGFDENKNPVSKVCAVHLQKKIQLNHYYTKSEEDWRHRLTRPQTCLGNRPNQPRSPSYKAFNEAYSEIHKFQRKDDKILYLLPELRKRLKKCMHQNS